LSFQLRFYQSLTLHRTLEMTEKSISAQINELYDLYKSDALKKEEYEQVKAEIIGEFLTDDSDETEKNFNKIDSSNNIDNIESVKGKELIKTNKYIHHFKKLLKSIQKTDSSIGFITEKILLAKKKHKSKPSKEVDPKRRENIIVFIILSVVVVIIAGVFLATSFSSDTSEKTKVTHKKKKPIRKKTPKITVKDIDGNVYNTVKIGNQIWTVENLKTVHYNDGTPIELVTNGNKWRYLTSDAYCWYNNDSRNKSGHGALYNGYTISNGNLCPTGWHVPSDKEWEQLSKYLENNGYGYEGNKSYIAKALASKIGWHSSNEAGEVGYLPFENDSLEFDAKPSGIRFSNGDFRHRGQSAKFWSSSQSSKTGIIRFINYDNSNLVRFSNGKQNGFSVRCMKNK